MLSFISSNQSFFQTASSCAEKGGNAKVNRPWITVLISCLDNLLCPVMLHKGGDRKYEYHKPWDCLCLSTMQRIWQTNAGSCLLIALT